VPLTVFLVSGVKLQRILTWLDSFSLLLKRDAHAQFVYKHAVSTVMPAGSINLLEQEGTSGSAPAPLEPGFRPQVTLSSADD
jgi:host factor-I protein